MKVIFVWTLSGWMLPDNSIHGCLGALDRLWVPCSVGPILTAGLGSVRFDNKRHAACNACFDTIMGLRGHVISCSSPCIRRYLLSV